MNSSFLVIVVATILFCTKANKRYVILYPMENISQTEVCIIISHAPESVSYFGRIHIIVIDVLVIPLVMTIIISPSVTYFHGVLSHAL